MINICRFDPVNCYAFPPAVNVYQTKTLYTPLYLDCKPCLAIAISIINEYELLNDSDKKKKDNTVSLSWR